jgi:hypothetical protein
MLNKNIPLKDIETQLLFLRKNEYKNPKKTLTRHRNTHSFVFLYNSSQQNTKHILSANLCNYIKIIIVYTLEFQGPTIHL